MSNSTFNSVSSLLKSLKPTDLQIITKYDIDPVRWRKQKEFAERILSAIGSVNVECNSLQEKIHLLISGMDAPPSCKCGKKIKFNKSTYGYNSFCSSSCAKTIGNNSAKDSVLVDDKPFASVNDAAEYLGVGREKFRSMLFNTQFPNIKYQGDHDQICRDKLVSNSQKLVDVLFLKDWIKERKSISELASSLGVHQSICRLAFLFHGFDTKFSQISNSTREKLNDENTFREDFSKYASDGLAVVYDCSPSLILQYANKYGCPMNRNRSAVEFLFEEWIREVAPEEPVLFNDRSTLGFEVDVLFPEKKVAVEFDGLFFHAEGKNFPVDRRKYQKRQEIAHESGIHIMRFTDIETNDKMDIIKSMILSRLGRSKRSIYARNCSFKMLTAVESRSFFDANHMSGFSSATHHFGLVFEGELVFAMSFGKPRYDSEVDFELIRMATLLNTSVVGGTGKLLSEFSKRNQGKTLLSYCDWRFGTGNTYLKLGFSYVGMTKPGFSYSKNGTRFSRFSFQSKNIRKMCPIFDESKSESENAFANGYRRYWDCGNLKFIKNIV